MFVALNGYITDRTSYLPDQPFNKFNNRFNPTFDFEQSKDYLH